MGSERWKIDKIVIIRYKVFREKGVYSQDEYYCEYNSISIVETFKCEECGNIFTASQKERLIKKSTCLGCDNRKLIPGYNSLDVTHPALAKEWSKNNKKTASETHKKSIAHVK